jgi:hypothetical protein
MGAAKPYIGQVTCQGEGVPPTILIIEKIEDLKKNKFG